VQFQLTAQAIEDLDDIWWFIQEDSKEAADRVEIEDPSYLSQTCRISADRTLPPGYYTSAGTFLDSPQVPTLHNRLPAGNRANCK